MPSQPPSNLPLSSPGGSASETGKTPLPKVKPALNTQKPSRTGESEPLAPKSFKSPKPKKGNGRKIVAVAFGSLIVIFLIGAIGLVVFRLFTSDGDETSTSRGTNDDRTVVTDTVRETAQPVDLGPWTTPPPCLNLQDQNVWILDDDEDLLTTAEERLFGTDPCNPDTDGDGTFDGQAVKDGQDPRGGGRLDYAKYGLPDPEFN